MPSTTECLKQLVEKKRLTPEAAEYLMEEEADVVLQSRNEATVRHMMLSFRVWTKMDLLSFATFSDLLYEMIEKDLSNGIRGIKIAVAERSKVGEPGAARIADAERFVSRLELTSLHSRCATHTVPVCPSWMIGIDWRARRSTAGG